MGSWKSVFVISIWQCHLENSNQISPYLIHYKSKNNRHCLLNSSQVTGFPLTLSTVWKFLFYEILFHLHRRKNVLKLLLIYSQYLICNKVMYRTTQLWSRDWNSINVCFHLSLSKVPFYLSCGWLSWHKTSYSQCSSVFSAKYWRWGTVSRLGIWVSILG